MTDPPSATASDAFKEFAALSLPPPHCVIDAFLGEARAAELLDFALQSESEFELTTVYNEDGESIDQRFRSSVKIVHLGHLQAGFEETLKSHLPQLMQSLGEHLPAEFELEIELVAHNHGAFFKRHKDRFIGDGYKASRRLLTMVYYLHRRPPAFSGGNLLLYPILADADAAPVVVLTPEHDRLVVFPSWFDHKVEEVLCPSRAFADSRFAINCWLAPVSQDEETA